MMAADAGRVPPSEDAAAPRGVAFIDGRIMPIGEARIPLLDMGFLRSDATYDVVHVWRGVFFRLDDHLARFLRNADRLRLRVGLDRAALGRVLASCVARARLDDAYVAMIVTRGVPNPGSRDPRTATNRFYAFAVPFIWLATPDQQERGLDLHLSHRIRIPPRSVDPTIKNYHWLDLEMALFDAYDRGADTAILVDEAGNIVEGPGFNAFIVAGDGLATPGAGVLDGITRRTVMEIAAELGIAMAARPISAAEFQGADEIFLTSTAGGVMPVTRLDGRRIGDGRPGPVTRRIWQTYWRWHEEPRLGTPVASLLADAPAP
jgi:branched-subunit amino acid aminotransferase/4-amino-4-deoxychorismate lyase